MTATELAERAGELAVVADSTSSSDLARMAEIIRIEHGRLDVLVANAGVIERADVGEVTEDHFDRTFDLNARGTAFTVQALLPLMPSSGSIILVGSIQAQKGLPGSTAYSAAKAAVRSYARVWAAELAGRGPRVNVLTRARSTPPSSRARPSTSGWTRWSCAPGWLRMSPWAASGGLRSSLARPCSSPRRTPGAPADPGSVAFARGGAARHPGAADR